MMQVNTKTTQKLSHASNPSHVAKSAIYCPKELVFSDGPSPRANSITATNLT